jgi:hypothetical protein
LRVLDSEDALIPGLPENILNALDVSNLDQIIIDSNIQAGPPNSLGAEPKHDWCYYFQRSDLARQQQNWVKIEELWNAAVNNKLSPVDPTELFPFIEAFVQQGKLDTALQISEKGIENSEYTDTFCEFWNSMINKKKFSDQDLQRVTALKDQLDCSD